MKSVNAKLAVVAVALATAGILFWRWAVSPGNHTHYYMGLAVVLVAVLWGAQYAALAGYAYLTSGGRKTPAGSEANESGEGTADSRECDTSDAEEPVVAEIAEDVPSIDVDPDDATP